MPGRAALVLLQALLAVGLHQAILSCCRMLEYHFKQHETRVGYSKFYACVEDSGGR